MPFLTLIATHPLRGLFDIGSTKPKSRKQLEKCSREYSKDCQTTCQEVRLFSIQMLKVGSESKYELVQNHSFHLP